MNIGAFLLAAILLTLLPGPDILFITTQSIIRGYKQGVIFAAGLCTGLIVHTSIVAFGLAAIITGSVLVFSIIKYAGAMYLVYLGLMSFSSRNKGALQLDNSIAVANSTEFKSKPRFSLHPMYKRGIIMNLLNPKIILFFLALFPQFVYQENVSGSLSNSTKFLILGLLFIVQAFVIFSVVAFCAGSLSRFIIGNVKFSYILAIIESLIFVGFGLGIVFL